jgi:predicted CXXCH cytochrome family protein
VAGGDCSSCHRQAGGKIHPKDKGAVTLTEEGAKLCYQCHDSKATLKYVHGPVASGDCTACHDPHHADNLKLLKLAGAALCLQCHEDMFKHKHNHAPVEAGDCLACHDPHQSSERKLLKKAVVSLCEGCHYKRKSTGKDVHAPVSAGNCTACHAPHGSAYPSLLKHNFPAEFYLPYQVDEYALCFTCHNRDIALDRETGTLTNFRNGLRNLHTVHVNQPAKGRTCKTCHDPHASRQEMLIKDKIPGFGKWEIPISYRKTATGGGCVVGCHQPRSYDRMNEETYK